VIEGAGPVYGIAGAEKSIATVLYNFAGRNPPPPTSTTKVPAASGPASQAATGVD
jgi:hypothetical protein